MHIIFINAIRRKLDKQLCANKVMRLDACFSNIQSVYVL